MPTMRNPLPAVTRPRGRSLGLALLAAIAALAGCGMKGDLYLPPPDSGGQRAASRPAGEPESPPPAAEVQAQPSVTAPGD